MEQDKCAHFNIRNNGVSSFAPSHLSKMLVLYLRLSALPIPVGLFYLSAVHDRSLEIHSPITLLQIFFWFWVALVALNDTVRRPQSGRYFRKRA